MSFSLGARSRAALVGVHPDLVQVVERAIAETSVDFTVIEGRRTLARQRQLLAAGKSHTLRSRHLTGHAVDLVHIAGGVAYWGDPHASGIAAAMLDAGKALGIAIEWGGHWTGLHDTPHFQLSWAAYPLTQDEEKIYVL